MILLSYYYQIQIDFKMEPSEEHGKEMKEQFSSEEETYGDEDSSTSTKCDEEIREKMSSSEEGEEGSFESSCLLGQDFNIF
ncbi:hypothetical protein Avbf_03877 [Armadillidium vulgare]|nr:hypothetical protein Avbf_03877 [Armadillidium vulgare]